MNVTRSEKCYGSDCGWFRGIGMVSTNAESPRMQIKVSREDDSKIKPGNGTEWDDRHRKCSRRTTMMNLKEFGSSNAPPLISHDA